MDEAKLHEFMGKLVTDMGGAAMSPDHTFAQMRLTR